MFWYVLSLTGRWDDYEDIRIISRAEAKMCMVVKIGAIRVVLK